MTRHVRIREPGSGLDIRVTLLDELAPRSAQALWLIAGLGSCHEAIHAMWTGPEISCPIPEAQLPATLELSSLVLENATSYPHEGDVAVLFAPANSWNGQPAFGFLDIGLFYGRGARLLMPMGWLMASICGRVVAQDMDALQSGCKSIRRRGACALSFSQEP